MNIPIPPSQGKTIYDYGFDGGLNRAIPDNSTGVVYDAVGDSVNAAQVLQGGNLTLKTLSIGGLTRQVAPGDDLQAAIDAVSREGGGTVQLLAATYKLTSNIYLRTGVTLNGAGRQITILDFQNYAYGIRAEGLHPYSDGTIAVNDGGTTVTGTLTTFTGDMVGRSIQINGATYDVVTFTGATSIEIYPAYYGPNITDNVYTVFEPVSTPGISNLQIINSAAAAVQVDYSNEFSMTHVWIFDCDTAVAGTVCEFFYILDVLVLGVAHGVALENIGALVLDNTSVIYVTAGDAVSLFRVFNSIVHNFEFSDALTDGLDMSECSNIGIENGTITRNGDNGIEMDGDSTVAINQVTCEGNTDRGLFAEAVSGLTISQCDFSNNLVYGVDLDSVARDVVVSGNTFSGNGTAPINDASVGAVILNNTGVPDNEGKLHYRLKNTSGGAIPQGAVVVRQAVAAGDESTTTTTNGLNTVLGVAAEDIASATYGRHQTLGKSTVVLVNNSLASISIGDFLSTYSHAYYAKKASAGETAFAFALSTPTTSTAQITALLISPRML